MMLGEKVSATEAETLGMVYKVFEDQTFNEAALSIVATLSKMPTRGLAYTKQALQNSFTNNLRKIPDDNKNNHRHIDN